MTGKVRQGSLSGFKTFAQAWKCWVQWAHNWIVGVASSWHILQLISIVSMSQFTHRGYRGDEELLVSVLVFEIFDCISQRIFRLHDGKVHAYERIVNVKAHKSYSPASACDDTLPFSCHEAYTIPCTWHIQSRRIFFFWFGKPWSFLSGKALLCGRKSKPNNSFSSEGKKLNAMYPSGVGIVIHSFSKDILRESFVQLQSFLFKCFVEC